MLDHLIVKLFNSHTKKTIYVDVKYMSDDVRRRFIDPNVLLVLHTLSGCDSTSYIRHVTKEKLFQCFFDDPFRYSLIMKLTNLPPPPDVVNAAEELVINCY